MRQRWQGIRSISVVATRDIDGNVERMVIVGCQQGLDMNVASDREIIILEEIREREMVLFTTMLPYEYFGYVPRPLSCL